MKFTHRLFFALARRNLLNWLPDKTYLKICIKFKLNRSLDFDNPITFNEKLQWIKVNDRKGIYTTMVDKHLVKGYVAGIIGEEYIIPTLGVWDTFEDIDFSLLPDKFVLKCTHDSGGLVICKDKSALDVADAKRKINKCLKRNYYWSGREWPYKNVKPRIIAEQYLEMSEGQDVSDYKVHCFNGIPKVILVCKDRFSATGLTEDFFDTDWNHLNISRKEHDNSQSVIEKPILLDTMLEYAALLSKDIPFSRIDFYEVDGRLFFGEITFFPASGMKKFIPEEIDEQWGTLIDLKKSN